MRRTTAFLHRRFIACGVGAALAACGGAPVLSHLPQPDPAVVAAAAAAVAGAATLADPTAAQRVVESSKVPVEKKTVKGETMPNDVLDRLEAADADHRP